MTKRAAPPLGEGADAQQPVPEEDQHMNDNPGRSSGQASEYRREAASLRLMAHLWDAAATTAETAYNHLGSTGMDFGMRVARRLRECAREAVWTATQVDVFAVEAQEQEDRVRDVGRVDEGRLPNFAVVRGGAA